MAEFLFIQPSEIASTTIMGGNVDIDKYIFCVADTQISVIEPLLGTELYDVIVTGATAGNLAGLYSTLYTEFVKPITKHEATAKYIEIASYSLTNGGLFKHQPENSEVVDKEEAQFLSQKYSAMAQMYVQRFDKWICKNTIAEFKRSQDEVDAQSMKLTSGWYFGGNIGKDESELW
tara:strand:+ start:4970 stop:5497 length:528 start_codon:yes stop_codon:yes gene_type:complete